jgi:AcrR family transcriptional regulator
MAKGNGPRSVSQRVEVTPVPARRRADAERNRGKLLDAARSLLADRGLATISIDELAAVAGVGKGTVFRAFGDKAGLARALLDDAERALQQAVLDGPPPLGPGPEVGPMARIDAFVRAYVAFLDANVEVLLVADTGSPTARYRTGAYAGWTLHLRTLLDRIEPGRDNDAAAHAILALLSPELFQHLRTEAGYSRRRLATVVADTASRIAGERNRDPAG